MSDTRLKFLKQLQRTMKKSTSATERTAASKLYAQMTFGVGGSAGASEIVIEDGAAHELGAPVLRQMPETFERAPSEYDETAAQAVSQPRSELCTLLMLVAPPMWMSGNWGDVPTGWINGRDNDKLLTFDEARVLIADRISELGLNPEKVYSYPKSRLHPSVSEYMAFLNAPFEIQMSQFRN
jgi:hypothetical protein